MSDNPIVKIERTIMAYRKPARFSTQYGPTTTQHLTDDIRQKMGGESVVYFFGKLEEGKWVILDRAPKQTW